MTCINWYACVPIYTRHVCITKLIFYTDFSSSFSVYIYKPSHTLISDLDLHAFSFCSIVLLLVTDEFLLFKVFKRLRWNIAQPQIIRDIPFCSSCQAICSLMVNLANILIYIYIDICLFVIYLQKCIIFTTSISIFSICRRFNTISNLRLFSFFLLYSFSFIYCIYIPLLFLCFKILRILSIL